MNARRLNSTIALPFLLFSALIHFAGLWGLIHFWSPSLIKPEPGLIFKAKLRQAPQLKKIESSMLGLPNIRTHPIRRATEAPTSVTQFVGTVSLKTATAKPPELPLMPSAPTAAEMIERAKADIRSAASLMGSDPRPTIGGSISRSPSPIERATTQPQQDIEQLAGGLTRITLASGRKYCLQDLPEIVKRDGPVTPMAVPMNCP